MLWARTGPETCSHPSPGGTPCPLVWHAPDTPSCPQGKLRRVDIQLLGQLCSLGLEMGALQEDLVAILEEEEEESSDEEAEEEEEPQGKQEEGCLGTSFPIPRLPDFEMTI